jgi:2-hydroxychromene-2-carboxylate isomerase
VPHTLDYFLAPSSPWSYLGHQRLRDLCTGHAIPIRMMPIDLGKVFPQSGGLPLPQRAPQRQAYRLVELARWRDITGLPLNLQPRFFPVSGDDAALVLIGAQLHHGDPAALDLAGRVLSAVWAEERNIADPQVMAALIADAGLDGEAIVARRPDAIVRYEANTKEAIARQVFGAPWYVWQDEPFWGQDRLDFLERALASRVGARG